MSQPVWTPAHNTTVTINSVPWYSKAEYSESYAKFPSTPVNGPKNAAGALATQIGVATCTTTMNITVIIDQTNVGSLQGGRQYPCSWTGGEGESHSGNIYILTRGKNAAVDGGYEVACSGEFTGVVSGQ